MPSSNASDNRVLIMKPLKIEPWMPKGWIKKNFQLCQQDNKRYNKKEDCRYVGMYRQIQKVEK